MCINNVELLFSGHIGHAGHAGLYSLTLDNPAVKGKTWLQKSEVAVFMFLWVSL